MAEQSHQDVVTQSLSADASSSVDVSAIHTTESAARAAGDKPTNSSHDEPAPNSDNTASESVNGVRSVPETPLQGFHKEKNPLDESDPISSQNDTKLSQIEGSHEEDHVKTTRGEGSVGSDTDTSKTDAAGDAKESIPRYAPKKPAGFKPVSVTKNFLAKAGTVSTPVKSSTEKSTIASGGSAAPSAQPLPRPRLVAKSASGQRNSLPKTLSASAKSGLSNGPDPSQVWNKNRVQTPQAVPKQLTDEELRQQYGIQLASRPLEDENSNQAKWADIDDEDDWAPETIEWNDGTKVNLAENAAAVAAANAADAVKSENASAKDDKPRSLTGVSDPAVKPTSIGPNATVLKLGSGGQHKSSGSISKSSPDKPSLVSKPASSTPTKSPWATLPAVEKVPPVQINPVNPPVQNKPGQRDSPGMDHASLQLQTKEMEADDFSRLSRDTSGAQRELYVPQSGRYEPVRDTRRGSRNDGNYRQPSVLQRPSQGERDPEAPPGPSAAFQTNRSQQDSTTWARRRGSSGVSGESGKIGRRMSVGRTYDPRASGDGVRRGSQLDSNFHRDTSPTHSLGHSLTSQSPTVSAAPDGAITNLALASGPAVQQNAALPPSTEEQAAPGEDPVALQKRLMREKREAAIKRRQEEEAKAEAEKRERIRIKMEELGMSPDTKSERKDKTTRMEDTKTKKSADEAQKRVATAEPITARLTSPPKPPAPSPSGEPQQYGLMKVHAPQPAHLTSPRTTGAMTSKTPLVASHGQESASNNAKSDPKSQLPNGENATESSVSSSKAKSEIPSGEQPASVQSWSHTSQQPQPGNIGGWSANTINPHAPVSGSLWGPPSNHRALGNGDFQNSLPRPPINATQPGFAAPNTSTTPQPIGTPRQLASNRNTATSGKSDLMAGNLIDDLQGIPSLSPPDSATTRPDLQSHGRIIRANYEQGAIAGGLQGTAPASQSDQPQPGIGAWNSFSANNGRYEAEQAARDRAARLADPSIGRPRTNDQLPVLQETWKQVSRGQEMGQRHVVSTTQVTNNYAPGQVQPHQVDLHRGNGPVAPPTRSRFQDIFEHQRGHTSQAALQRPPSPLTPPPDSAEHPAYVGGDDRPLVNLPGSRVKTTVSEKPIVKLPPAKGYPHSAPTPPPAPPRVQSWSGIVKQSTVNQTWQERINGLWATKGVPSPPVQTASKPRFDLHPIESSLAISLPPKLVQSEVVIPERSAEEEEVLFEDGREFGSLPTIKLSEIPTQHLAWTPLPRVDWKDKRSRALRDEQVFSIPFGFLLADEDGRGTTMITVKVGSMPSAVTKAISREVSQGARRGNRQSGRRSVYRNPKSRDASSASLQGSESTTSKDALAGDARASSRGFKTHKPYRGGRNGPSSPVTKT